MHFPVFVIERDVFLQAVLHYLVVDYDRAVRREGADSDFEDVEQFACIPSGKTEKGFLLLDGDVACPEVFVLFQCLRQEDVEILGVERFEYEDLASRKERGYDFERRIFGRGSYQDNRPAFDRSEQCVLLGFVETVDFVNEKYRRAFREHRPRFCPLDYFPDVLDPRTYRRQRMELPFQGGGYNAGESGFPYSGRAPEYERRKVSALYHIS
jgi:hypothetical protein